MSSHLSDLTELSELSIDGFCAKHSSSVTTRHCTVIEVGISVGAIEVGIELDRRSSVSLDLRGLSAERELYVLPAIAIGGTVFAAVAVAAASTCGGSVERRYLRSHQKRPLTVFVVLELPDIPRVDRKPISGSIRQSSIVSYAQSSQA